MSITIPTAEIHEGLKKCKEKTENYFAIAKTCMNENKNDEGYVNAISGLEEFGRASMFFESLKNAIDANSDVVTIEKRKIYNHIEKQKTALSILPPALRNLAMGTLNPQNYTDDFVADRGGQITVLQDLRERAQFVDYRKGSWQTSDINANGLKLFVEGVESAAEDFINYAITYAENGR